MMDKNKRYTVWNKISIFFVCAILLAGSAGCGRKNAAEEKTKSYTDSESSEIEVMPESVEDIDDYLKSDSKDGNTDHQSEIEVMTESVEDIDNYLKSDKKDMNENKLEDTKESGQSETETPEEKTKRLRAETVSAPSVSADEVTDLRIEIHKKQHALQLWNEEELIAEYPVGLAKNPTGAKEKEGDNKNPEGSYYICNKNSRSQYHLALGISYPNIEDANRGYEEGLINESEKNSLIYANEHGKKPDWYTALGGEIMIHGQKGEQGSESDWTRGCFAVDNEIMDFIWDYVEVGTPVLITAD